MIERRFAGILPPKPHTAFRDAEGKLFYEEMFTRGGFAGAFTYFYHRSPITPTRDVAVSDRGFQSPVAAEDANRPLKRRLYDSNKILPGGQAIDGRVPVLFNRDVTVYLLRATKADDAYFANGDGDELWYVQEGEARLESPCGWLDVKSGDYVWVPHSMMHRWHPKSEVRAMVFEAPDGVMIPREFRNDIGQLKMDAPYTHRDFVHPQEPLAQDGPRTLLAKKGGVFSRYTLAHAPMDVVGWDGFVYPWAFAIEKYQPKTGLVHLPPTIHSTFASPGFLVCSFVPRLVDFHPQAIPCPYPHSSVDCDEIILYLRGNFTSRRGVGPGCISLHPAGIAHGPHPGAYENSIGTTRTDELAVMMDTYKPLLPTAQARNIEVDGYHETWSH
jgi:homogentisate 1,2-dioxygenase